MENDLKFKDVIEIAAEQLQKDLDEVRKTKTKAKRMFLNSVIVAIVEFIAVVANIAVGIAVVMGEQPWCSIAAFATALAFLPLARGLVKQACGEKQAIREREIICKRIEQLLNEKNIPDPFQELKNEANEDSKI